MESSGICKEESALLAAMCNHNNESTRRLLVHMQLHIKLHIVCTVLLINVSLHMQVLCLPEFPLLFGFGVVAGFLLVALTDLVDPVANEVLSVDRFSVLVMRGGRL